MSGQASTVASQLSSREQLAKCRGDSLRGTDTCVKFLSCQGSKRQFIWRVLNIPTKFPLLPFPLPLLTICLKDDRCCVAVFFRLALIPQGAIHQMQFCPLLKCQAENQGKLFKGEEVFPHASVSISR